MNEPIHAALAGAGFSAESQPEGAEFASDRILAHLDEHQRAVRLAHHEIQFAGAHGHVRSNQHEAAPLEE